MKKVLVANFLLLTVLMSFGANRYLVSGGTGNWNSTTNWSATSGGASGASVPVAGDAVIIDTNSANAAMKVNVTAACASITIDNAYTGAISMDAVLTTTSSVRLGTGMTLTGASAWTMNTSCTITSSGKSFPELILGGTSQTFTLADTLRVSGLLTLNGTTATTFSGAYAIVCGSLTFTTAKTVTLSGNITSTGLTTNTPATVLNGSFTLATAGLTMTGAMSGTALLKLTGGAWSGTAAISNTSLTFAGDAAVSGSVAFNTGSIIYSSGTITTTSSTLNCSSSTTFNCNSITWNDIALSGTSKTHTLSSDLNLSGTLTLNGVTATTFSGSNIVTGNLTFGTAETITIPANLTATGTTTVSAATVLNGSFTLYTGGLTMNAALTGTFIGILFNATGTWSGSTTLTKNVTINTPGTLTVGTVAYSTGTLTYTGGTVSPGSGTITLSSSATISTSGMTWANVNVNGSITLGANCNLSGNLTINTTGTALNGAYTYNVGGSVTHTGGAAISGASTILMNGKGTASVTNSAGAISCPFTINTTDTITFGTNFRINNCTFTYTAGTIVATGSTFETVTTASTININGNGFKMGTYLSAISQAFGGSYGFTMGTFNCHAAGKTFTFAANKTYTITNEISIAGTSASHCAFVSSTSGTRAIVTLNQGAAEDVGFCNATDINSSSGKTILTYKGTRSNTLNWNLVPTTPKTGAFSFN